MKSWKDLPVDVLKAAADLCDGHTILNPDFFITAGVPKELIDKYTETLKSDFNDPKRTIFAANGEPIEELVGVYGYYVLEDIVRELRLKAADYLGRGSQASEWQRVIYDYVNNQLVAKN